MGGGPQGAERAPWARLADRSPRWVQDGASGAPPEPLRLACGSSSEPSGGGPGQISNPNPGPGPGELPAEPGKRASPPRKRTKNPMAVSRSAPRLRLWLRLLLPPLLLLLLLPVPSQGEPEP